MSLKTKLARVLEPWELEFLPHSYDIIGDIAVVWVPEKVEHRTKDIAEVIMQANMHVKTVLQQISPVSGDLRLREFKWIYGEKKTETVYRESGCVFKVDLEKCYFSPRLSYERMRVARQVKPNEVILNMFAGVGTFSIIIAKCAKAEKIYSIDVNPVAVHYMRENVRLNRTEDIIEPIEGDAKEVIEARLRKVADRVLMPLPEKAYDYLDYGIMALKADGGLIHYYDFVHAEKNEKPVDKVGEKVSKKLRDLDVDFTVPFGKIVRTVGPRWFQIVLDISVTKTLNKIQLLE